LRELVSKSAISQVASIVVVILIILVAFGGYAFGSVNQRAPTSFAETQPITTVISGTTETVVIPITTTIVRSLPNGTILEVVIQKTGTQAGGGYCMGSNVSSCIGLGTLQLIIETSTSYIFPTISGNFNATVKTSTSYGVITCVNPKTTTTTVTQNSTFVYLISTWTATCSG